MRRIPQRTMYKISVVYATKISPEFNFNVVVCNVCLCFSQKFIGFCTSKSQINSNYSMTEPMRPTCNRKQMSPEIRCRADKDVVEDKKRLGYGMQRDYVGNGEKYDQSYYCSQTIRKPGREPTSSIST